MIQGLGYFFPSLYLPSYATSIGLSSAQGTLLLALLSVSRVLGQFSFGYLSDHKLPLNLLVITSTLISAIASLALWGLARSLAVLLLFSFIYGFFGAGYAAMVRIFGPFSPLSILSQGMGAFLSSRAWLVSPESYLALLKPSQRINADSEILNSGPGWEVQSAMNQLLY
jgi:MFS family permease